MMKTTTLPCSHSKRIALGGGGTVIWWCKECGAIKRVLVEWMKMENKWKLPAMEKKR